MFSYANIQERNIQTYMKRCVLHSVYYVYYITDNKAISSPVVVRPNFVERIPLPIFTKRVYGLTTSIPNIMYEKRVDHSSPRFEL